VHIAPDIGILEFEIVTTGENSLSVSEEAAAIYQGAVETLRDFGFGDDEIRTTQFSVSEKSERKPPSNDLVNLGFVANHKFRIEIRDFSAIGKLVNAVVGVGVKNLSKLEFESSEIGDAQQQALASAARSARQQAAIMAEAAGGHLGDLLEMESERYHEVVPAMAGGGPSSVPVTIVPSFIVVRASVSARWEFLPNGEH
jgi:uncharacterized protein YggE